MSCKNSQYAYRMKHIYIKLERKKSISCTFCLFPVSYFHLMSEYLNVILDWMSMQECYLKFYTSIRTTLNFHSIIQPTDVDRENAENWVKWTTSLFINSLECLIRSFIIGFRFRCRYFFVTWSYLNSIRRFIKLAKEMKI